MQFAINIIESQNTIVKKNKYRTHPYIRLLLLEIFQIYLIWSIKKDKLLTWFLLGKEVGPSDSVWIPVLKTVS